MMKKILIALSILLVMGGVVSAQPAGGTIERSEIFTVGDLDKLGKLQLTKIYIDQVQKLNLLIPYVPFNQKGEAVALTNMGIPNTKDNNAFIKKLDVSCSDHNQAIDSTMANVVPYADKPDIIKAILFIQDVIQRIELGI
ncbi:MAG: hypothetical protein H6581_01275 [Bacteroidia bacterium]|nr:hypothetical protein [Bacteroidia bacterium]